MGEPILWNGKLYVEWEDDKWIDKDGDAMGPHELRDAVIEAAKKVWRLLSSDDVASMIAGPKAVGELGEAIEALQEVEGE